MGIGTIIRNLMFGERKVNPETGKPMSADEVELRSFMERERRDRIKVLLAKYRAKEDAELLMGKRWVTPRNILKTRNSFGFRK